MKDELLKHFYEIKEAAFAILRFVRGNTFAHYEQDELLRSGVERKSAFVLVFRQQVRLTVLSKQNEICISFSHTSNTIECPLHGEGQFRFSD